MVCVYVWVCIYTESKNWSRERRTDSKRNPAKADTWRCTHSLSSLWQYLGAEINERATAGQAECAYVEGTEADLADEVASGNMPSPADEGSRSILPSLAESNPEAILETEAVGRAGKTETGRSLHPGTSVATGGEAEKAPGNGTGMGPEFEAGLSLVKLASMGVAFVALPKTFPGCPVKIVMRILGDIESGKRKPLM